MELMNKRSYLRGNPFTASIMEAQKKDTVPSTCENRQTRAGLGKFMVDLAGFLTVNIVLNLATYFDLASSERDKLRAAEYPGLLMVEFMRERGIITQTDISPLIKALEFHKLEGVKTEVLSSFYSHVTEIHDTTGKLNQLRRYLKASYELLFKAIRPIPYLRDMLYCVKDVFVEGGIEVSNLADRTKASGVSSSRSGMIPNKLLKSYRDIFDDNILPSKRVIVEGEPGYGKSTLTLQAAYDWCKEHQASLSAFKSVELFILLPLRLMKGVTNIYKAIKLFLLPRECNLTESDIKLIINSCTAVVIVLDGYDEYPDKNSNLNSDLIEIIKGKMFTDYKLILCTRSGCLPSSLDPRTIRVRLTGFDANARDRYIRMAVTGDSHKAADEMMQNLQNNPIMSDLCQNPLFFVMFVHMAHESDEIWKCDSVTSFFRYMIHCFYSHMWRKDEEKGEAARSIIANKSRLHKVAFDGLVGDDQTTVWDEGHFRRDIGTKCFEELKRIGIIVRERFLEINIVQDLGMDEYIKERHTVRFCHKLFAEWYAAHYLSERADNFFSFRLNETFAKVNPIDLQFVFRFACGLKPSATKRIVNYLRGIDGGEPFATLCILERTGGTEDILGTLREMCLKTIHFRHGDNHLLQRSRIQLLSIASKNEIAIVSVKLHDCFLSVDHTENALCLSSGLHLPRLDTLKELQIYFSYKKDLRLIAGDIFSYLATCGAVETVKFFHLTLLPKLFDNEIILANLHRKNCKVQWLTFLDWVQLNTQTGKWEKKNGQEMTDDEYGKVGKTL